MNNKTKNSTIKGVVKLTISNDMPLLAFFTTKEFDSNINDYLKDTISQNHDVFFPIQKHTDNVYIANEMHPNLQIIADAVVTNKKNLFIGVKTADCVPIIIFDEVSQSIGVIHAGWRGTSQGIVKKTIKMMTTHYGASSENIQMIFCPSIGRCCYEIDKDVFIKIMSVTPEGSIWTKKGKKYFIDLQEANMLQATETGIKRENVNIIKECTYCLSNKYHSYRRDGMAAGRQFSVIGMTSA
ncbi:MAG: peptidoglycan editing factor PgeF [Thermodesulfovibrionales bacterium]|nr:peptidoglycan editing factor PgeF [Thermodesulfovibrionales bacterium]